MPPDVQCRFSYRNISRSIEQAEVDGGKRADIVVCLYPVLSILLKLYARHMSTANFIVGNTILKLP